MPTHFYTGGVFESKHPSSTIMYKNSSSCSDKTVPVVVLMNKSRHHPIHQSRVVDSLPDHKRNTPIRTFGLCKPKNGLTSDWSMVKQQLHNQKSKKPNAGIDIQQCFDSILGYNVQYTWSPYVLKRVENIVVYLL